jgi:hypothetical protein
MRVITRISFALAGTAALVGSMALPASAEDTTTTAAITDRGISISAPTSADLGVVTPGQTATVALTGVQVSDLRASDAGWNASVTMSDLTGVVTTNVIPASAATYTAAAASTTGTVALAPVSAKADLSTSKSVQSTTSATGDNSATWDADLSVAVPKTALKDNYTAVITHSVA